MKTKLMGCVLALGFSASVLASDSNVQDEIDALKQKLEQQAQEISDLRAANSENWLNERRTEEIKSLVHEVLADAETRASFSEHGMTAGWNDGNFFLASEDGNFLLNIGGQVQVRYLYADRDEPGSDSGSGDEFADFREHHEGFSIARTVLNFDGHLFDPRFTYHVSLLMSDEDELTSGGFARLQNAWFAWEWADGWQFRAGQFKPSFLRDENVHSSQTLAVERALVTDLLTIDYTQGAEVSFNGEMGGYPVRSATSLHDGSYAANTGDIGTEGVDWAVSTRGEILLAGEWEQFNDYATWSGDAFGLMVGAALDYENAEGEDTTTAPDTLKWTVDGSLEAADCYGANAMIAWVGSHPSDRNDPSFSEPDQYTLIVQGGFHIIPDEWDFFARWEWLDLDGQPLGGGIPFSESPLTEDVEDQLNFLTFGTNYYFHNHAAKLTFDVLWALDEVNALGFSGKHGILFSDTDDQFALRCQFQYLF